MGEPKFRLKQEDRVARGAFKRGFEFALAALNSGVSLDDLRQHWPALFKWRNADVGRYGIADLPDIDTSAKLCLYDRFVSLYDTTEGLDSKDAEWVELIRSALSEPGFACRIFGVELTTKLLEFVEKKPEP